MRRDRLRRWNNRVAPQAARIPGLRHAYDGMRRRHLRTEQQLLAGRTFSRSEHPSVVHFSISKSATQYVRRILGRMGAEVGLVPVNLNTYAAWSEMPYLNHWPRGRPPEYAKAFHPKGYLYSSFNGWVRDIPGIDDYRKLLVIRDPRDVLTSQYYSTAFSHPIPGRHKRRGFEHRRERARSLTIDEHVLERVGRLRAVYETYATEVLHRPNLRVLTYERLVGDFEAWLEDVAAFTAIPLTEALRTSLVAEADAPPEGRSDDKRRQVSPGDHRRQLHADTVERLDVELADVLVTFGYS